MYILENTLNQEKPNVGTDFVHLSKTPNLWFFIPPVRILEGQEKATFGQLLQEVFLPFLGIIQRDVEEDKLSRALHVELVRQPLEKIFQNRGEVLATLAVPGAEEQQQDPVLESQDQLSLGVQLIPVTIILHQDFTQEQVHHDPV